MNSEDLCNPPIARDLTAEQMQRAATSERSERAAKSVFTEINTELRLRFTRPPVTKDANCNPIDTGIYLRTILHYIEGSIANFAAGYSAPRWLWYLRRLPRRVFQGNIPTTFAYDAGLAETASGLFGTGVDNLLVDQESLRYPIDDAAVTRVLRFCHAVRFMSHVHSMLRYAGKGVVFRFEGRDPVPSPSPAHDEQKAIRLFDDRLGEEIGPFRRGGTKLAEESPGGNDVVIVVHRIAPIWAQGILGPLVGEHKKVQVYARFCPETLSFQQLRELNSDPRLRGKT